MARSYQAVVIGGGPGGYVAGIKLGQLGVKTAVIERESIGGVCLNWGCVPSKALIHVAHTVTHVRDEGPDIGIQVEGLRVDLDKTRTWKDGVVKKLTGGVRQLLKGNGADVISGEARFLAPGRLEVRQPDGHTEEVHYEKCIIATGARPIEIPGFAFDGETVWSAKNAVDLPLVPERLTVIGGGIIGMELGTVYAKLGSKVTVVEMLPTILAGVDRDLVQVVERRARKLGMTLITGAKAKGFERKDGALHVTVETEKKGEQTFEADRVLVAVGFRPNSERLGLEAVGVQTGPGGAIVIDERLQTTAEGIFAIGDVTGGPFLAHRAFKQGEVAAEVIAGHQAAYDVAALPGAIFTDPEVATTGLSEAQAKEAGYEVKVGKFSFGANGRALGSADTQGFVKVVVDAEEGVILGVHIVGLNASELISEGTLAVEMGAVAEDVGLTIHPHPTLSEAVQEATLAALGQAVHMMNR